MVEQKVLWQEKKKLAIGLPWTFTEYTLTEDTLQIKTGFFSQKFEEIKLYRIRDFIVSKNIIQRIFKLGTIHVCSADSTTPEFDIKNIYKALEVKNLMSKQVDICKAESGVTELLSNKVSHQ